MTIGFEIGEAEKSIKSELSGVDIDIGAIVEKFSSDKEYFIRRDSLLKNDEYIEHVLSEMYNIPKEIRMELFKVKIMELLLRLKMLDKSLYKDDRQANTMHQNWCIVFVVNSFFLYIIFAYRHIYV